MLFSWQGRGEGAASTSDKPIVIQGGAPRCAGRLFAFAGIPRHAREPAEAIPCMFDFAWSEIALIGAVALLAIGPKDLPVAMKAITDMIKKARRMASEFQTHVDDMVKDANLGEVRDQINELRTMDIKGKILDAVDGDQTMRKALNDDPFATTSTGSGASTETPAPALAGADATLDAVLGDPASVGQANGPAALEGPKPPAAPAFIPPSAIPVQLPPAPAFIPPDAANHLQQGSRKP